MLRRQPQRFFVRVDRILVPSCGRISVTHQQVRVRVVRTDTRQAGAIFQSFVDLLLFDLVDDQIRHGPAKIRRQLECALQQDFCVAMLVLRSGQPGEEPQCIDVFRIVLQDVTVYCFRLLFSSGLFQLERFGKPLARRIEPQRFFDRLLRGGPITLQCQRPAELDLRIRIGVTQFNGAAKFVSSLVMPSLGQPQFSAHDMRARELGKHRDCGIELLFGFRIFAKHDQGPAGQTHKIRILWKLEQRTPAHFFCGFHVAVLQQRGSALKYMLLSFRVHSICSGFS